MRNILLLEDDSSFGYIMKTYLEMNEFQVQWVKSGHKVSRILEEYPINLCLLDVMLPEIDGFQVAKNIRAIYPDIPFIFLTARSLKVDKLKGYKLGCDDYITKPVDEELLLAKINAILKRTSKSQENHSFDRAYSIGKYEFNFNAQLLKMENGKKQLTGKEAKLLKLLCDHHGQLVKREDALKLIWGKNDMFNRKTMDVFIYKLRKYLNDDPSIEIKNIHGKGFILQIMG